MRINLPILTIGALSFMAGISPVLAFSLFNSNDKYVGYYRPLVGEEIKIFRDIQTSAPSNVREFWTWFDENEKNLYDASDDQDSIIVSLKNRLKAVDPNLTVKLGWTTACIRPVSPNGDLDSLSCGELWDRGNNTKRRMLAISSLNRQPKSTFFAQILVANARLPGCKPKYNSIAQVQLGERWLVTLGEHPPVAAEAFWIDRFIAKKNGENLELIIYSNNETADSALLREVGTFYRKKIAEVIRKPLGDAPKEALPKRVIYSLLDRIISEQEISDREKVVCKSLSAFDFKDWVDCPSFLINCFTTQDDNGCMKQTYDYWSDKATYTE